jgi:HK97 family phage portal protein
MGILSAAWNPTPRADVTWSPLDDRLYSPGLSLQSDGAVVLSADSILRCGPVLAAVRFRGDSWAMCPPSTYLVRGERRIVDSEHYSHRVLRNPNAWQTGNRWRHLNGVWLATWGNAFNEIVAGRESIADELRPLHPSLMDVVDQRADGSLVYRYRRPGGEPELMGQERVLHFRDIGTDGVSGLPMWQLIRNVVGIAMAAEQHTVTFLKKGARVAGLVQAPSGATTQVRDELRDALASALGGPNQTATFGVVPFGVEVKPIASTNKDGQLLELSDAQVGAILRFLGVPGVVAGYADKTATYASAKEFFESGGIKHCVLPILTNVEAEEEKALLVRGDGRQIKHNLDALLRASWSERMTGLVAAVGGPFMAINEARDIEDMDPMPDPRYDRPHIPSNMAGAEDQQEGTQADPEPSAPQPPARPVPADDADQARASKGWQFALDAGARIVRREVSALRDRAPLAARDPRGWREWVVSYYERHAAHVETALHIEPAKAASYADGQRDAILVGGLSACDAWEETVPYRLAAMAYGEEA